MGAVGGEIGDEELLQFLYALPVAAFRMDAEGRIDLMTPTAARLLQGLGLLRPGADGWALLRALDAALAERAHACLLTPGTAVDRHPVDVQTPDGRRHALAVGITVIDPGVLMVVVERTAPPQP
jgi:PAS domain-containing protein